MELDNSFIRLENTFTAAKNVDDPILAEYINHDFIPISPDDRIVQVTNSPVDIVFNGDVKVELIDCCGRVLLDITDKTAIKEFTNSKTGIKNISFEIVKIGQSFIIPVHLKFTHTQGPERFYSNPFHVNDFEIEKTAIIEYSGYGRQFGADYISSAVNGKQIFQRIRLKLRFEDFNNETEQSQYTQESGNTIGSNITKKIIYIYPFEKMTYFAFEALTCWMYSDLLYINGVRCTVPKLSKDPRSGNSNMYAGTLSVYRDRTDLLANTFQLTTIFDLIAFGPKGKSTVANLTSQITGSFNADIVLGTGFLTVYDSNGNEVATYDETDIVVVNDTFTINIAGDITDIGAYNIQITPNLFNSANGQTYFIDVPTKWVFELVAAQFKGTQFKPTQFITEL